MCPSFHVDKIPCRLLITLSGNGTEWIPNSDVDWPVFTDPADQSIPLRSGATVQQLPAGHWSLLKVEPGTALIMVLSIDPHEETANDSFCHWIQFFIKASQDRFEFAVAPHCLLAGIGRKILGRLLPYLSTD